VIILEKIAPRIAQVIWKMPYHIIVQMFRKHSRADEAFCGKVFKKLMKEVEPALHKA